MKESVFNYVDIIYDEDSEILHYIVHTEYKYYSKRYNKWIVAHVGMPTDGATGALDINSFSWLIHDKLKVRKTFEDGTKCSNWKASCVIYDILKRDGFWFRARSWYLSTLMWGTFVK